MKKVIIFLILTGLTVTAFADWVLTTVPTGLNPWAVTVNLVTNKIYIANQGSNTVTVIDGMTFESTSVPVGNYPYAIAANSMTNKIYVANYNSANVTVIDGATKQTNTITVGSNPNALAVNPVTNNIYVANDSSNNVTVIDGATNGTNTVAVGINPRGVAVNQVTNQIYVTNWGSSTLTVIDGNTNLTTLITVGTNPFSIALNPVTNKIYVANWGSNNVSVIDGSTNGVTTIAVGNNPNSLAINPVTNKIYVANYANSNVTVIDGAYNRTRTVTAGDGPSAVAVNPVTNKIYVANAFGNTVTVINGITYTTTTISTGDWPYAIKVNPVTNKVYVTNFTDNNVTVIDGITNSTTTILTGNGPHALAINPITNKIYVANIYSDNVTVIDGVTNSTNTVTAGDGPYAAAVNSVTNKIYVANFGNDRVTVIDGITDSSTTILTGDGPNALAINPITNKIYVANIYTDNLTVIDGFTNDTTSVATGDEPGAVAVNPVTNKIYVANLNSNNVTVIDGITHSTTTISTGTNPRALAVNPVTNKIYVVNLSSYNMTVIDGSTNSTTTVVMSDGPYGIAANPVTNKIYVANEYGDNVTVIEDAPVNDTKVRAEMYAISGNVTYSARPFLAGIAVNRLSPFRTRIEGILNHQNTSQQSWGWAQITGGIGTDSVRWSWDWGTDSLLVGENFVCLLALESDAAITNNHGLGTPFAGNLLVYPIYRLSSQVGPSSGWLEMASIPTSNSGKNPKSGSCMAGLPADGKIYFLKASNKNDFLIYTPDIGLGVWTDGDTIPKGDKATGDGKYPKKGAAMAAYGDAVYVLRGNNTLGFWKYIAFGSNVGWQKLENIPPGEKKSKGGSGLVPATKSGNDYIFAMKGSKTTEFYLYDITNNTWEPVTSPPVGPSGRGGYKKGSCLAYDGNDFIYVLKSYYGDFFKYSISKDSWYQLRPYDAKVFASREGRKKKPKDGAGLVYYNGNVYMLKSGNTFEFWMYDNTFDTWFQMDPAEIWDIPVGNGKKVKSGGCITILDNYFYVAKGANTPEFYKHAAPVFTNNSQPKPETDNILNEDLKINDFELSILPNPANNLTIIRYKLPVAKPVSFKIYDIAGAMVKSYTESSPSKKGSVLINFKDLTSGVYILRFSSDNIKVTQKLVIQK